MKVKGITIAALLLPGAVVAIGTTTATYTIMLVESFYKTNYVVKEFVGLANYAKSIVDPRYHTVIGTSFLYSAIITPAVTFIPLMIAMMIYDMPAKIQHITKFVFFVPSFAAGVIISQSWRWIFQPQYGVLTWLLGLFGIEPIVVMGSRYTAIFGLSIMSIMGGLGLPLLLYMSSISSIDPAVFDAARIDGASKFQRRMRIVFPLLIPTIFLIIFMTMTGGFFLLESILMMTGGGRGTASFLFDIYDQGFNRRAVGVASARSIMTFIPVALLIWVRQVIKKRVMG